MKFWILDLGMFNTDDWHTEAEEREGRSAEGVAEEFAAAVDEDCCDGGRFEVIVAEDKEGKTARCYHVRCNAEISYRLEKSKDCEIPPPVADEE